MDTSASKLSPNDGSINLNVSEPHNINPKQNVSTSFVEICDSQTNHSGKSIKIREKRKACSSILSVPTAKTQVMKQLNTSSEASEMRELSGATSPVPLLATASVEKHSIDQQSELSKFKLKFYA